MNNLLTEDSSQVMAYSLLIYKEKYEDITLGKDCIIISDKLDSKNIILGRSKMNYFLLTKYRSVEENILFTAKILYELLGDEKRHVDQLYLDFASKQNITINLNIERILYLSLTFLFSLGKITFNENMIERVKDGMKS